ncbi:hypothetical protein C8Q74DRAFT_1250296 [Fomes fomentarius]|nr:hypothetical protein C8Q74DRAFT_1250296 [Fomes fomentarius]
MSCIRLAKVDVIWEMLCYIPWAVFSGLRVFALSSGNWLLGSVVVMLSLAPVAINFADFHWATYPIDPI